MPSGIKEKLDNGDCLPSYVAIDVEYLRKKTGASKQTTEDRELQLHNFPLFHTLIGAYKPG